MTGRVIRYPIADPLETALLAASPPPAPVPVVKSKPERPPFLGGLPEEPRGGGSIEWKRIRHGDKMYGPYPYLRLRIGGRQRSIYLKALAHATRESATSDGQV